MDYEQIRYAVADGVLTLTLDRPDRLNAYTAVMGRELADALHRADADDDVRAVVLTGAGRAFCAGADLSAGAGSFDATSGEGATTLGDAGSPGPRPGGDFVDALFRSKKPTITAFNGPAVGVGVTLALPTDIKIAADTARFGFVFARRGLVPEAGAAWFLPRIVGHATALRWCLMGDLVDATEAQAGGLVSEVVPAGQELDRAYEIARHIASKVAPVSAALVRAMIWRLGATDSPYDALAVDGTLIVERGSSPDVREGVAAFLEKRDPVFPGRVSTDLPDHLGWW